MSAPHPSDKYSAAHLSGEQIETIAVHAGRPAVTPDGPVNAPIVLSSTTHAGGPYGYMRDWNETLGALEETLGALEGGKAIVYSSGMGATSAVFDLIPDGSPVVASQYSYTGVAVRLKELHDLGRIELRLVDVTDAAAVAEGILGDGKPASWVWLETPTNPMLEVCDIRAAAVVARSVGAYLVIDNTFMTPARQRPLELGAHVVMHSVTKGLAGHSDLLMGALVTNEPELAHNFVERRVLLGTVPSAFDAFLVMRGIRTLAVRVDRAEANAQIIAERLQNHAAVKKVYYPGLVGHKNADIAKSQSSGPGTVLSFETVGDADTAERACRAVDLITHATSLGGVETLMERRRRWAKENSAVPETLIRLSVGIENVEDIWRDLDRVLNFAMTNNDPIEQITPNMGY